MASIQTTNNTGKHKVFTTKNMVMIAMFGAVSLVLMLIDFPLPFAPAFLKFDFADLPAILGTFMMGPVEGVLICVVKLILKLIVRSTETAFVGEFANLIAGMAYMLPAALLYHFKKGKSGAVLSLAVGTLAVSLIGILTNMYLMFPAYSKLYGLPMDVIIGMGTEVNGHITNMLTLMVFAVLPFNVVKYGLVSVITFFVYKRLKHVLFRDSAS